MRLITLNKNNIEQHFIRYKIIWLTNAWLFHDTIQALLFHNKPKYRILSSKYLIYIKVKSAY